MGKPGDDKLSVDITRLDYLCLDGSVWVATAPIESPSYDFDFPRYFPYQRHWYEADTAITVIGRFGVAYDYDAVYERMSLENIKLVNSPEQHFKAGHLDGWYPAIADLTARSRWYAEPPAPEVVELDFSYPMFIRGAFQTNRHKASLAVVHSRDEYLLALTAFRNHPRLIEQKFVVREYLNLRLVEKLVETDWVAPAFEFRSFWWNGELVGFGNYWSTVARYTLTQSEEIEAVAMARRVARRVNVPFLVVDIAQETSGKWVTIECNDGQESGYAGVPPLVLWQNIIELCKMKN